MKLDENKNNWKILCHKNIFTNNMIYIIFINNNDENAGYAHTIKALDY